jgi:hypothetical protein
MQYQASDRQARVQEGRGGDDHFPCMSGDRDMEPIQVEIVEW